MKLSFWHWVGIVIIISIIGGIIYRYRAIKVLGEVAKAKVNKGDSINYSQSGD